MNSLIFANPAMLIFIGVTIIVIIIYKYLSGSNHRLPPGPWSLPIIGYPFWMLDKPYIKLTQLREKYGDLIMINERSYQILVLNSYKAVLEVLSMSQTAGRTESVSGDALIKAGGEWLVFNDGPQWTSKRKIASKALTVFQTPRNVNLDAVVKEHTQKLIEELKNYEGSPMKTKPLLAKFVACFVIKLLFGVEASPADIKDITDYIFEVNKTSANIAMADWLPSFSIFYGKAIAENKALMNRYVAAVLRFLDMRSNAETPSVANELKNGKIDSDMDRSSVVGLSIDIFDGAFMTITETLEWILLVVAKHKQVQQKMYEQVNSVVGNRCPSSVDIDNLHYVRAVVAETMRYVSTFPFSQPHRAIEEFTYLGYLIPKDTTIIPNLYAVNHDPDVFENVNEFNPERFIENEVFQQDRAKYVANFSFGKRRCIGEQMSKQALVVMLAMIIQAFELKHCAIHGGKDPMEGIYGIMISAGDHKILFEARK